MAHGVVFRCCVCCLLMVSLPLNAACFAELFLWRLEQEPAIQCVKQRGGHLMCVCVQAFKLNLIVKLSNIIGFIDSFLPSIVTY